MIEAPAEADRDTTAFDALDQTLRNAGPDAALDQLIDQLAEQGEFRALLDALLLKARHELGLPLIQVGTLTDIPEPAREKYEERYITAIRSVGARLLDAGDIPGAWPYFRAIAETGPVAQALDAYQPIEGDERLGQVIEVAFNQGAHPRKGFELILGNYGTCSAITAFEHLPQDETTRIACADKLVRQLHEHLTANLRAEIEHRGKPLPPAGTSITNLIDGHEWLFADDAYHIDVSHLASTVRVAPLLTDPETIALAVELTEYGRNLSERHRYEGDPPFEQTYEDHGAYLRALIGQDVDAGIARFLSKLVPPDQVSGPAETFPAQVLVGLLLRIGRLQEAIEISAEHLADVPEASMICPGVAQLCQRAGQPERLARIARDHGDLVHYAAAILQTSSSADRS